MKSPPTDARSRTQRSCRGEAPLFETRIVFYPMANSSFSKKCMRDEIRLSYMKHTTSQVWSEMQRTRTAHCAQRTTHCALTSYLKRAPAWRSLSTASPGKRRQKSGQVRDWCGRSQVRTIARVDVRDADEESGAHVSEKLVPSSFLPGQRKAQCKLRWRFYWMDTQVRGCCLKLQK